MNSKMRYPANAFIVIEDFSNLANINLDQFSKFINEEFD